jgi:hypothetical protein
MVRRAFAKASWPDRANLAMMCGTHSGIKPGRRGPIVASSFTRGAGRKPACREPAPKRRRSGAARFRNGMPWADRVGSRRPGDDALAFLPVADREVIFTVSCGRRSSCGRRQRYPVVLSGATVSTAFADAGGRGHGSTPSYKWCGNPNKCDESWGYACGAVRHGKKDAAYSC